MGNKIYFEILETEPDASIDDIKQAYRDLVNVWHPDRFLHNARLKQKAEEKMKEINKAYNIILSDIDLQRKKYEYSDQSQRSNSQSYSSDYEREEIVSFLDYKMIFLSPGTFVMGSDPMDEAMEMACWYAQDGNYPGGIFKHIAHRVTLTKGLYMGETVVTQKQWYTVMGTKPWYGKKDITDGDEYPAVYLSWEDCNDFIDRLNKLEKTGKFKLPTEAEWEYACRAGTTTDYFWGDDLELGENYVWMPRDISSEKYSPHEVGKKNPNPWGFHDMLGNVYECCQDWYVEDISSYNIDPTGPINGKIINFAMGPVGPFRVARGGCYSDGTPNPSYYREMIGYDDILEVSNRVGFRLSKTI